MRSPYAGAWLIALLAATPIRGAIDFTDSGQTRVTDNNAQTDVALGDLDRDGDLDAVTAGTLTEIWINQGQDQQGDEGVFIRNGQTFSDGQFLLPASTRVALADLDGDGDLDFVTVHGSSSNRIRTWINLGGDQLGEEGQFELLATKFGNDTVVSIGLDALDENPGPDLYVTRGSFNADEVWWNDGAGQFSNSGQTLSGGDNTDLALGDVNGDGFPDAFVATRGQCRVLVNSSGAGMFVDTGQSISAGPGTSVALGDVDGDGDLDAVLGLGTGFGAVLLVNQGPENPGVFANGGAIPGSNGLTPSHVALGDFDGDDDLDLFVPLNGADRVFANDGGGGFSDTGLSLGTAFSGRAALGDLNGDNRLDAFVANSGIWLNAAPPPFEIVKSGDPLLYVDGETLRFSSATLRMNEIIDWAGSTLTLRITANYNVNYRSDLLGILPGDGLTVHVAAETVELRYNGVPVATAPSAQLDGTTSSPLAAITFNANATAEAVEVVLKRLSYNWLVGGTTPVSFPLRYYLARDALHLEPSREWELTLETADGHVDTCRLTVDFDRVIDLEVRPRISVILFKDDVNLLSMNGVLRSRETLSLQPEAVPEPIVWKVGSGEGFEIIPSEDEFDRAAVSAPTANFLFGDSTSVAVEWGPFSGSATVVAEAFLQNCVLSIFGSLSPLAPAETFRVSRRDFNQTAPQPASWSLVPLHGLEALMNQTPEGRRLADLYWRHTREVLDIFYDHPEIIPDAMGVLNDFGPAVTQLLGDDGGGFVITQGMIDRLNGVWDQVIGFAGPELSQALQSERAMFNGFQDFVNRDFDTWASMLGVAVPDQPFIHASNPRIENGGFKIDANHVEGLEYSLWQTTGLGPFNWVPADGFEQRVSGGTIEFINIDPPSGQRFFQIRAAPPAQRTE